MKITFILPIIGISGGTKAVFEFANHLHDRGHDVCVVYPLMPMRSGAKWCDIRNLIRRSKSAIAERKQESRLEWFDLKANLIRVPTLAGRYIPDGDIVVATWWETAYYVRGYPKSKGEKFYLAQHYEVWGGPEERVNESYRLGLRIIVNSTWLQSVLENRLGVEIEALILHAPDLEQFYPEKGRRGNGAIRILMPYRRQDWKGDKDGIRAFEMVQETCPEVKLVMFGAAKGEEVPPHVEFHEWPVKERLRQLYNSCDIFVYPSHHEGFGMPPMEAMACKCAVVTTNVGAVPDYAIPGRTALVSPPKAPQQLAENIMKLVEDDELRKRISEAGYHHVIKNFSWGRSTGALEETFKRALAKENRKQQPRSAKERKQPRGKKISGCGEAE
jgi:hypothetical protein